MFREYPLPRGLGGVILASPPSGRNEACLFGEGNGGDARRILKSCMTLGTLYLGNNGATVYYGPAGFLISTALHSFIMCGEGSKH